MRDYPFRLINPETQGALADPGLLRERPFVHIDTSFQADARRFAPTPALVTAINTAVAVGAPLLVTGEPGAGKTQSAYYAAYRLGIEPVLHFQVKSECSARDLLYHFDTVRYFHDANLRRESSASLNKADYVEKRHLWKAMTSDHPRVLLIDEIDKAPRDFPNDLLHEIDKMEFTVAETQEHIVAERAMRPIVFITSNSERRLPEPFLRRCVYHHIEFDDTLVHTTIERRMDQFPGLSRDFIQLAVERFLTLRQQSLRKRPAMGELLVWLRVLSLAVGTYPENLDRELGKLPYLGTLLKDYQDMLDVGGGRR
ncbi:MAG: MoxR family ATPase [Magnetococcus sp. MYC-9]